jgi:hypothetical protein
MAKYEKNPVDFEKFRDWNHWISRNLKPWQRYLYIKSEGINISDIVLMKVEENIE